MPKGYIGVDPGAKGYLCLLVPEDRKIDWCNLATATPASIYNWILEMNKQYKIVTIMIEDVHSLFGMSAKSNFSFGYNLGLITSLCQATEIGVDKVAPKVWQKTIGVKPKSKTIKKDVAQICEQLYPTANIRGSRGGLLDGKSDSLMIAHHTFKQFTK